MQCTTNAPQCNARLKSSWQVAATEARQSLNNFVILADCARDTLLVSLIQFHIFQEVNTNFAISSRKISFLILFFYGIRLCKQNSLHKNLCKNSRRLPLSPLYKPCILSHSLTSIKPHHNLRGANRTQIVAAQQQQN